MKKTLIFLVCIFVFNIFANKDLTYVREITYSSLYNELIDQKIEFPDIVFAQALLESGNFTSRVFLHNNNLFGMKIPKKRKTLAVGQKYGYAKFDSWEDCISDYGLFQQSIFKNKKMSRNQYLSFIDKRYSESKDYVAKLNIIIKKKKEILFKPPQDRVDGKLTSI